MIINFIAFQICWLAAVWGAAQGMPWLGPCLVVPFAIWELGRSKQRKRDLQFVAVVAVIGLLIDSLYRQFGLLQFASPWPSEHIAPLWIVGMWVAFALTVDSSMRWLAGKPLLASVFGLVGGPLAYWVAIEIWNAASFTAPSWLALLAVGIAWAIVTPMMFVLLNKLGGSQTLESPLKSIQAGQPS